MSHPIPCGVTSSRRDQPMTTCYSDALLQSADSALCLLVFFPAMLFYWRGIRDLFSVYIEPGNQLLSDWITFGIGCLAVFGYFAHPALRVALRRDDVTGWSTAAYVIASRAYMFVYGAVLMAYWRGLWNVADHQLSGYGALGGGVGIIVCFGLLAALRTSRSIIFPPFVVTLDTRPELLEPTTLLQTSVDWSAAGSVAVFTCDAALTHFGVTSLTILCWRSIFSIYDSVLAVYISPLGADVLSLVVGFCACVLLFSLDNAFGKAIRRLDGRFWPQLVLHDSFILAAFLSEAALWRGAWNLNARYMFADPLVGGWVNFVLGTVLLVGLQLLSYVGACGCCLDVVQLGSGTGSSVVASNAADSGFFHTRYLRSFCSSSRDIGVDEETTRLLGSQS